ncbi:MULTISPECIES: signal peptide peptidase SppA [unclassified Gemella]|uniref:signal peptide peptidase SppA n=1 Tax=unclassified Gemella TaxID=2624949 RepID=UPI001C03D53A|nr:MULTISPECIES: signal peptide peptidase SppA [unclassified Gemella]MBU0278599.1 signal peptide peptidase SppA [Gemella sp. zg-1178]QWQ38276.1 signal peptide peptidase SppA [Gemella sp. zg-570]
MKNKKRLIALISSVVILILSISFGNSVSVNKKSDDNSFVKSLLNKEITGSKIVLRDGDSSNVIQRIKVKGTIDDAMADEEAAYSVINQIHMAKNDPNVKAILLVVDSPGGGVYESNELYNALVKSGKDVYVSMESLAASGGYYISMAAKKIYAHQETITGSIGVIMSNLSAQQFLNEHGIKNQIIRSGEQKAVGGLTEDMNEATIATYKELNLESYNRFVDLIAKGRNMDREKVLSLADGRIYSAEQALKNGLIDKIASQKELISDIEADKKISNAQVVEYKAIDVNAGLLNRFINGLSKSIVKEIQSASAETNIQRNYLG